MMGATVVNLFFTVFLAIWALVAKRFRFLFYCAAVFWGFGTGVMMHAYLPAVAGIYWNLWGVFWLGLPVWWLVQRIRERREERR